MWRQSFPGKGMRARPGGKQQHGVGGGGAEQGLEECSVHPANKLRKPAAALRMAFRGWGRTRMD